MLSCRIFAFFDTRPDYSFRLYEPPVTSPGSSPPSSAYQPLAIFRHYRSTISCDSAASLPVSIRPPLPGGDSVFQENTLVYVIGDLFVRTGGSLSLIDASKMYPVRVNGGSLIPSFASAYVDVKGTVVFERDFLSDGSVVIYVEVSQYVRNRAMQFQLASVYLFSRRFSPFTFYFQLRSVPFKTRH